MGDGRLSPILHCHPVTKTDIVRADGTYLYDRDGRRYVDFESGIWCTSLGHNHPRIQDSLVRQAGAVIHLGPRFISLLAEEAAHSLLRHVPFNSGKVVFLSSGSEAVEMSIRLAREITGRSDLLAFSHSYLGAYGDAGRAFQGNGWAQIDIGACQKCARECTTLCTGLAHLEPEKIAAFVLEPVLASGGIIIPPHRAVRLLGKEIKAAGGLIVVDEVTTGFGRTGAWFGVEHFDIEPDIIAVGKALGNGYPVSAVAMRRDIGNRLERRNFYYVQSHQNDPLGCAIAGEVIAVLEEEDLISRSRDAGAILLEKLSRLKAEHPIVSGVRGLGLMMGLEFGPFTPGGDFIEKIFEKMFDRGYVLGVNPNRFMLRFLPPLTIGESDIVAMCDTLGEVLTETEGGVA